MVDSRSWKRPTSRGIEIERKFLVSRLPPGLADHPSHSITQGYLAVTPEGTEVRVRDRGGQFFLTIKHGTGVVRRELELRLTEEQFRPLWALTRGRRLCKTRFVLPHPAGTLEVDVYCGLLRGLKTVEIEFPTVRSSRTFKPPDWFGPEITHQAQYHNRNLALGFGTGLGIPHSFGHPSGFSPVARPSASIGRRRAANDLRRG